MTVIFLTPILISIWAAGYMAFVSEAHVFWRVTVIILVGVAWALQAIDLYSPGTHFLVLLLIQLILGGGVYIWSLLEGSDPFDSLY